MKIYIEYYELVIIYTSDSVMKIKVGNTYYLCNFPIWHACITAIHVKSKINYELWSSTNVLQVSSLIIIIISIMCMRWIATVSRLFSKRKKVKKNRKKVSRDKVKITLRQLIGSTLLCAVVF